MAYSDYGGYAYRNGERVKTRSDFTITPNGGFGTPGIYPPFAAGSIEAARAQVELPHGHAVLGDGPLYLLMYKQTHLQLYHVADGAVTKLAGAPTLNNWDSELERHVEEIDGVKIEVAFEQTDNIYCYAKMTMPNGAVWTGFSGYGVGAGLESGDHGFSTQACVDRLQEIFNE